MYQIKILRFLRKKPIKEDKEDINAIDFGKH